MSAAAPAALDAAYADALTRIGLDAGLHAVGVAPAEPFVSTRADLETRKADGLHGGMQFTYRNPARSTDPSATLPGARALVVGARAYRETEPDRPPGPAGRVARYAWRDHYGPLRTALGAMADRLRADGWRAVAVADDNALVDREAAHRAGLGWYGKNANLLLPGRGSWFVLGAVITDAPLPPADRAARDGCGPCRACLDACPTGALVAPGIVDARRCLAWLLQRTGSFPRQHRAALGERIYGCDDCQEVCPPNLRLGHRSSAPDDEPRPGAPRAPDARRDRDAWVPPSARDDVEARPGAPRAPDARRGRDAWVPPSAPDDVEARPGAPRAPDARRDRDAWVPLLELLAAPDDELLARHGRWYVPQRQARWLRRNALVVLGNVARAHGGASGGGVGAPIDPDVESTLRRYLADPDPMLRAHAAWAAHRLERPDLVALLAGDDAPEVVEELTALALAAGAGGAPGTGGGLGSSSA